MAGLRFCGNCGLNLRNLTAAQQNTLETGLCPRCGAAISVNGDVLYPTSGQWPAQRDEGARGGANGAFDLALIQAAIRPPHEQASRASTATFKRRKCLMRWPSRCSIRS